MGTVLKVKYPSRKFKVVVPQNDDTPHQEVEKILQHRYNNDKKSFEYFVKWKDIDEDENSWEPESSCDSNQPNLYVSIPALVKHMVRLH